MGDPFAEHARRLDAFDQRLRVWDRMEAADRRDRGLFTPEQREDLARQDAVASQVLTEIRTETVYVPRDDARPDVARRADSLEAQLRGTASPAARRFLRQQAGAYRKAERVLTDRVAREMNARMIAMIDAWERRLILGGGKVGGRVRFEFVPVTSSMVGAAAYDADERELHVRFNGGQTYIYGDVPREVYDGLLKAESVGRYLNAQVKGRYQFRKGE